MTRVDPKYTRVAQKCTDRPRVAHSGPEWRRLDQRGPKVRQSGPGWPRVAKRGPKRHQSVTRMASECPRVYQWGPDMG